MTRRLITMVLAVIVLIGWSATSRAADEAAPDVLTNTMCPVMTDKPAVAKFWAEHEGQRVNFCCARCRGKFMQDPSPYVAVLASATAVAAPQQVQTEEHAHDHAAHEHDDEPTQQRSLIAWLGQLHVVMVHFPIGLIVAATIAELLHLFTGATWLASATRFCVWAGAIGALIAAPLGWFNAGWNVGSDELTLAWHRWLGTTTLLLMVAVVLFMERAQHRPTPGRVAVYRAGLFLATIFVAVTGHLGGVMVYGLDYFAW